MNDTIQMVAQCSSHVVPDSLGQIDVLPIESGPDVGWMKEILSGIKNLTNMDDRAIYGQFYVACPNETSPLGFQARVRSLAPVFEDGYICPYKLQGVLVMPTYDGSESEYTWRKCLAGKHLDFFYEFDRRSGALYLTHG